MGVLDQFLKQAFTGPQLRDFRHASRLFTDNNYELSPKYQFLFFVRITLNPLLTRLPKERQTEVGVLAKSCDLPKFTVDVKKYNSYNRPNFVQTKLTYEPLNIKFHDDSADVIREFWYDYYSYYYRDSDYEESLYSASHKYQSRLTQDWGYTPLFGKSLQDENQLIQDIQIFSFHQKKFSQYTLHNPIITRFNHGSHDHSQTAPMEHDMTVQFETVTYQKGYVTPNNFGDMLLHYDQNPSPLTPAGGGTQSILGPGGIMDAASSVVGNLKDGNLLGALFVGGRAIQANKNTNLGGLAVEELTNIGVGILRGQNPQSRIAVPGISNLVGGAQNLLTGGIDRLVSGGGIGGATGANPTLLAGLGVASLAFGSSNARDSSPAQVSNKGITSNGDAIAAYPTQPVSNYTRSFPAINPSTAAGDNGFRIPAYSIAQGFPTINNSSEALPNSNQSFPNVGDLFA